MRITRPARPAVAGVLAAALAGAPGPARAALEEFENWSVSARELDDENGLDDMQRAFAPWAEWQWRGVDRGARVGMGCATTEIWEVNLDVKLRHWLSERVMAEFRSFQQEEIGEQVHWNEFAGSYAAAGGLWLGGAYRPSFEKEEHDAALFGGLWHGRERWARLRLGFEDALNNFWDERTEYIEDKERRVYDQQPFELEAASEWRTEGLGQIAARAVRLFPYERSVTPAPSDPSPESRLELSGWLATADWFAGAGSPLSGGLVARWKSVDREDSYHDVAADSSWADAAELRDFYLRPWLARSLGQDWTARLYLQGRWSRESHFDGAREHRLETRHLGGIGEVIWAPWRFLDIQAGLGVDDVQVEQDAAPAYQAQTHGSRVESRAILVLDFHWNGGRIALIETLEGDNEGYQTVGFHDKGFVQFSIEF